MDCQERLKDLSPEVVAAFSESFIFLTSDDKVQRLPARDLTQAEMIQRVKEELSETVTWSLWQGFVIAVNSEKTYVAVLPKYHQLDGFESKWGSEGLFTSLYKMKTLFGRRC